MEKNKIQYIYSFQKGNKIEKYELFFFYAYKCSKIYTFKDLKKGNNFIVKGVNLNYIFPLKEVLIELFFIEEDNYNICRKVLFKPLSIENQDKLELKIKNTISLLNKNYSKKYIPILMEINKKK